MTTNTELSCDWCGRPESEEPIEPAMVGPATKAIPMMLCAECRGVGPNA